MRRADLVVRLRRRHLVIALEVQLAAVEREDRVAAPDQRIGRAASRRAAAAPLVREEQLGAVVAERRRVPEGHVRVGDREQALRVLRIANVEQQTVARACAARVADRRIRRDVVATALTDSVAAVCRRYAPAPHREPPPPSRRRRPHHGRRVRPRPPPPPRPPRAPVSDGGGACTVRPLRSASRCGELTTLACSGCASGTRMISMRNCALSESPAGAFAQPGTSFAERTAE